MQPEVFVTVVLYGITHGCGGLIDGGLWQIHSYQRDSTTVLVFERYQKTYLRRERGIPTPGREETETGIYILEAV